MNNDDHLKREKEMERKRDITQEHKNEENENQDDINVRII